MDPVDGGMAPVDEAVRRYTEAGLTDVTVVAHPDARHEMFNETNRTEVVAGATSWFEERLQPSGE
ncbi:hypothetical protein GCM10027596_36210 [Nocardioides korecus]